MTVRVLLKRLSTFRVPRQSLVWLVLGVASIAVSQNRLAVETATVASLDSAIAAALPVTAGDAATRDARIRVLVAEKRDLQIASTRMFHPWRLMLGAGIGLIIVTILADIEVLVLHLIRNPSRTSVTTD